MAVINGSLSSLGSLNGNLSAGKLDGGLSLGRYYYSNVRVATTAVWNSDPNFIGVKNTVYVYSDHSTDQYGNPIPAFKVGDGLAYLIDLPFSDSTFETHIADTTRHITDEEREFWNNKVSVYLDIETGENIVFTTD